MNRKGNLIIVAAPSGAGKTTLVHALVDSLSDIMISVSHTTRASRPSEREGVDYFFLHDDQFNEMVARNEFLEHAIVFDHQYGTSKNWVLEKLQDGVDVILEIDWQGARQIRQHFPDAVSIFFLPPSHETLVERLKNRKQDPEIVIERRMEKAQSEMSHYGEFDYLVVNDNFEAALEAFRHVVLAARKRLGVQQYKLASLLADLL